MKSKAALGYRVHSGWAVVVVVGGAKRTASALARRRIEMITSDVPAQPYHAAEGLAFKQAERLK